MQDTPPKCDCQARHMVRVESPANSTDWSHAHSRQGYQVYRCPCGSIHGCRIQWDDGTGSDDNWHDFGAVDPATVVRHY